MEEVYCVDVYVLNSKGDEIASFLDMTQEEAVLLGFSLTQEGNTVEFVDSETGIYITTYKPNE